MRRALSAVVLALAASAAALGQANVEEARRELNLGAVAYRAGRFAEAEGRFRRALELDPEGKNTRLYLARALHQQYKPGVPYAENVAVGERAVAVYQEALNKDPQSDDAFQSILLLYKQMKNEQKAQELLLWRANDFSAPNAKRAGAFALLSSRHWQCSYDLTEQGGNKTTEQQPDKVVVKYKMPADQGDFLKARQCVTEGLGLAEQALALDPESRNAWAYKTNLLREAAKLAEMEGDAAQKGEYDRQAEEALAAQRRLGQGDAQAAAGDAQAAASETHVTPSVMRVPIEGRGAAGPNRTVITGGILNGKAVSKPLPAYPPGAKAVGAQGTVTVRIVVDEEGRVVEAAAVSGHPLLHEAAVAAARKARFSPTRLSGQAVKVTGLVTYNFVLR